MAEIRKPPNHTLTAIDLEAMRADCAGCGNTVAIRRLNSSPRPVCEPKLLATRRARRAKELAEDRAGYNAYQRTYHRLRKYGLSGGGDALDALLADAGGRCGICAKALTVSTMRIDHDHSCCDLPTWGSTACGSCVRGILCGQCNTGIGLLGDDEAGLRAALAYITKGN